MYSYEDCFLSTVCHRDFERNREAYVGTSSRRRDILILRDPFNLFASRLKSEIGCVTLNTTVRIWKQHARQFLGLRNYLSEEVLAINFNRWATQPEYRQSIAEQLGVTFTDAGVESVPSTAGGSSFNRRDFHGQASRMNVLKRWQHFQRDARYQQMIDPEVVDLTRRIFGSIDDSPEFLRLEGSLSGRED